jgi:hypothetical protein
MAALLKGATIVCEKKDQDKKNGRPVATCYADGVDIAAVIGDNQQRSLKARLCVAYLPHVGSTGSRPGCAARRSQRRRPNRAVFLATQDGVAGLYCVSGAPTLPFAHWGQSRALT